MARKEVLSTLSDGAPQVGLSVDGELLVPEAGIRTRSGNPVSFPTGYVGSGSVEDAIAAAAEATAAAATATAAADDAVAALADVAASAYRGKTVYLDVTSGNDSNDGVTPSTPKLTFSGAWAVMSDGDTLSAKRGGDYFNPTIVATTKKDIKFTAYGSGPKFRVIGATKITAANWVASGTANVWYVDVTHTNSTAAATEFKPMLYTVMAKRNSLPMVYKTGGAAIADNIALVAASANSFTCHRQGSTNPNPAADTASTTYRYYARFPSNEDPTSAAMDVYFVEKTDYRIYASVSDWAFHWSASKDHVAHSPPDYCVFSRVDVYDSAQHAFVGSTVSWQGCYAYSRLPTALTGAAFHHYRDTAAHGTDKGVEILGGNKARGFNWGMYSHGSGGGVAEHAFVRVRDFRAEDCNIFLTAGWATYGYDLENVEALNCGTFIEANSSVSVRNFRYVSPTTGNTTGILFGAGMTVALENGSMTFRNTTGQRRKWNAQSGGSTAILTFNKVTIAESLLSGDTWASAPAGYNSCAITATDSVLGDMGSKSSAPGTTIATSFTATNSQFAMGRQTLTELAVLHAGIDTATCVCPWVTRAWDYTVQAGDVSYVSSTRTASGTSGSPNLTISNANAGEFVAGQPIRIVSYDGVSDFNTVVVSLNSTGASASLTVADNAPGTFSGKTLNIPYFNKKLFEATTATPILNGSNRPVRLNAFGSMLCVSAGAHVYLGAPVSGRHPPLGFFTVSSMPDASTAELTHEWDWHVGIQTMPPVSVTFGNPLRRAVNSYTGATITVTRSAVLAMTGTEASAGTTWTGFPPARKASTGATGAPIVAASGDFETGIIDGGFPCVASDVLGFSIPMLIREFEADLSVFEGSPLMSGIAILAARNELARRGMGCGPLPNF